jgi:cell division protein FtsW (lipid II flippase)
LLLERKVINMIEEIMSTITSAVTGLGTAMVAGFTSIGGIFWDGTKLTMVAVLALVAAAGGLLYFAFKFVKGLLGRTAR